SCHSRTTAALLDARKNCMPRALPRARLHRTDSVTGASPATRRPLCKGPARATHRAARIARIQRPTLGLIASDVRVFGGANVAERGVSRSMRSGTRCGLQRQLVLRAILPSSMDPQVLLRRPADELLGVARNLAGDPSQRIGLGFPLLRLNDVL